MNRLKLLLLLLPLLATGCFDSKLDDCPPKVLPNTTIRFSLEDIAGQEAIMSTVGNIELFIYNRDGMQVSRSTVSGSDLAAFAGARLTLDPGTYTIVAWANATAARTTFFTDSDKSYLDRTANYLHTAAMSGSVENGDPLYYAPKKRAIPLTITIPEEGEVEVVAEFRHAHVKLEVTVEGYDHTTRAVANPLTVELTNLTSRYGFAMNAHGDLVSYVQNAPNTDPENKIFNTIFNIPVFDKNTTTQILVTNNAGNLITPVISLAQLLGENIDIEKTQHIPIKITFSDDDGTLKVAVTVDLPHWNEGAVKPNV